MKIPSLKPQPVKHPRDVCDLKILKEDETPKNYMISTAASGGGVRPRPNPR
jgi:hypothetical protein